MNRLWVTIFARKMAGVAGCRHICPGGPYRSQREGVPAGGGSGVLPGGEKGEERELGQWEPAAGRNARDSSRKLKKGRSLFPWRAYKWGRPSMVGVGGMGRGVARRWGLEEVLAGARSERKRRLSKAISFWADFFPSFQVCVAGESKRDGFSGAVRGGRKGLGGR